MRTSQVSPVAVGIAGSGRLAQALGRLLVQRGEPVVAIAGRDPIRTRLAAEFIGNDVAPVGFSELPARASRFLIAVSDAAIGDVADTLGPWVSGTEIALHTCGSRGIEELRTLHLRGIACGTLHPLQTICSPAQGAGALRGVAFGISGDEPAVAWAEQIVERAEGQPLRIGPSERPLYHAAAVMASNYLAALIDAAQTLMATATSSDREVALRALSALIRTAVDNILERGPVEALTGPIERGDTGTVRLHLEALSSVPPHMKGLYCGAGLHTVDLAQRKGLAPGVAEEMKAILR